jgi:hypothetical protein
MPMEREGLLLSGTIYIVDRYVLQHGEQNYKPARPEAKGLMEGGAPSPGTEDPARCFGWANWLPVQRRVWGQAAGAGSSGWS